MTTRPRFANPLLEPAARPAPRRVAVIGAGTIGPDIAWYLKSALPGLQLVLLDVRQAAIAEALARLKGYADKAVARGKMSESAAEAALAGLTGSTDYETLRGCDWVIEAATEDLALKRRIFAEVEARVDAGAAITSNTSSLPAQRIFGQLAHPERATVTHFFAPAWRNPVVEVVAWPGADPALVAWLRRLFAQTGKLPLVTADAPCFMLDRVFDNWCNEAALLLDEASAAQIDSVAAEFVHAGPFFVLNLAHGNPIILETNTLQADEEGEHYRPAPVFRSVERWNTVAPGREVEVPPALHARIRDRLLGVLWSQSVDILDRGIGDAADLDIGCRLALGFRRGPLELLRSLGAAECTRVLDRFVRERPGMPGPRRELAAYLPAERHVLVDEVDGVKVITLRRPEALNALHDELTDEILGVIRRHEDEPGVAGFAIVGYGGKAFCAGGDIGRFPSLLGNAEGAAQYARDCSRLLVHLDRARKPVVAALNGMALGGGFELATRCHALVAERGAWMQLPEVTLGILPAIGAMVVPYRRWPRAAAVFHGMLTRAERLKAAQAQELGIVDELADGYDALVARAVAKVHALAGRLQPIPDAPVPVPAFEAGPPRAADGRVLSGTVIGIIEGAVREAAAAPTLHAALEAGYRAFGTVACTAAAREGITAFVERRSPDFGATG
ncbi:3-hydroxyacyl-CoA dehydrogenase/enoyl-CoA hydratase family protein [Ramlibacter monticola]|uniref:enoyl-CoA hydratase n=1 Tax=Ramlibacter monticola TaxID=1926872 RepID=A0A937CRQ0_9BURK|nr:3-hydroxyacyl-CoA dehydrogenase/enoyl-CoA hydratase family protein [Ramlibacter monticola]MBL0389809.1 enoyl-CoA hydratase/isomerase family protein [Ramlibacter monticola]